MTLDGAGQLGGTEARGEALPARHRPRLSPPGCAMLALLLRFPQARVQTLPTHAACRLPAATGRNQLAMLHAPKLCTPPGSCVDVKTSSLSCGEVLCVQDASQKFAKAVASLSAADAAAVGLDPGGTRVLEVGALCGG